MLQKTQIDAKADVLKQQKSKYDKMDKKDAFAAKMAEMKRMARLQGAKNNPGVREEDDWFVGEAM